MSGNGEMWTELGENLVRKRKAGGTFWRDELEACDTCLLDLMTAETDPGKRAILRDVIGRLRTLQRYRGESNDAGTE